MQQNYLQLNHLQLLFASGFAASVLFSLRASYFAASDLLQVVELRVVKLQVVKLQVVLLQMA